MGRVSLLPKRVLKANIEREISHSIFVPCFGIQMGTHLKIFKYSNGSHKIIDISQMRSRIRPNMFRDRASILMQAKAKRKPTSATSVVGFGLVSVQQKMDEDKALL